jgi:putative tricarboxylic transport membrane protein
MSTSMLKRVIPYGITLALAVFLYLQADRFPILTSARMPGPDLWPKMICVLLAGVSLIGLLGAAFAPGGTPEPEPVDEALVSPPETHPYLVWVGVAATGLYVGSMPYLGFFIATVLFAAALLLIGGMRRWAWLAPTALALSGVFTLIFMKVVYVSLPLGSGPFMQVSLLVFKLLGIH